MSRAADDARARQDSAATPAKTLQRSVLHLATGLDQIYRRIVALADAQKHVSDDDLLAIITEVCGRAAVPAGRDSSNEHGYGFGV